MQESVLSPPQGLGIEVRDAGRVFPGQVEALANINLTIAPGEFVAILGPSGCGKSTLMRLMAGLDSASTGSVNLLGADEQHGNGADLAYVFQDAHLLPWRNVLRNVTLPLELMKVDRREQKDRARLVLQKVGLADALKRYPAQLSGGMRMRVSLARALVTNPRLLLLDEPFAALDEITRHRLDEQLRGLWTERGMTVVFVTHSTAEAVFLADRAVVLTSRPGRIVLDTRVDLPAERIASMRGMPEFAEQTRAIYLALELGDKRGM